MLCTDIWSSSFGFGASPAFSASVSSLGGDEVTLSYFSGLPDPSTISDSKVVVIFKGLSKRDSTTRERALNEFLALLKQSETIEDTAHWAWAQIYIKLSIDVSRSVRILAHKVQGRLGVMLGKRFGKYFKYGVGPWILGLFDTDRMVATAAKQSLADVLPASFFDEKKNVLDTLYAKFCDPLLDFIHTIIANETIESLSDERYVSREEAETKYYRTARGAIATLSLLITKVDAPSSGSKTEGKYFQIFDEDKLWKLAYSSDVYLSKAVLNLISTLFTNAPTTWADSVKERIATALISKGLSSSSPLVAVDFLQALNKLTKYDPECWDTVSSKKSPLSRLSSFIGKGNKSRSENFWPSILALLSLLPSSVSPYSYDADSETAKKNGDTISTAFLEAVLREPQAQIHHAWGFYMAGVERIVTASKGSNTAIISNLYDSIAKSYFSADSSSPSNEMIFKVMGKKTSDIAKVSLEPIQENVNKIISSLDLHSPSTGALNVLGFVKATVEEAKKAGVKLNLSAAEAVSSVALDLQEDPKDSKKAQFLSTALLTFGKELAVHSDVHDSLVNLINQFFTNFTELGQNEALLSITGSFVKLTQNVSSFSEGVSTAQEYLQSQNPSNESFSLLTNFLSLYQSFKGTLSPSVTFSAFVASLDPKLFVDLTNQAAFILLETAIMSHDVFLTATDASKLLDSLVNSVLREDANQEMSLALLLSLAEKDQTFTNAYFQTSEGKSKVSELWKASESHEHKSNVDALLHQLEKFTVSQSGFDEGSKELAKNIIDELTNGSLEEVVLLVQRAERLVNNAATNSKSTLFEQFLLSESTWNEHLQFSFDQGLDPSLSISPAFGNALYLTDFENSVKKSDSLLVSPALVNMAVFSTSLIHRFPDLYKNISSGTSKSLLLSLAFTSELIDVALAQSTKKQVAVQQAFFQDFQDVSSVLTSDIRSILTDAFSQMSDKPDIYLASLTEQDVSENPASFILQDTWANCKATDAKAFYSFRVLETSFSLLGVGQGIQYVDLFKKVLNKFDQCALGCLALLNSLSHTKVIDELSYLRNNLLGSLATVPKSQLVTKGVKYLALFIASLQLNDSGKSGLTFFKLMNFVRTLDSVVQSDDTYDEAYAPLLVLATQLYGLIATHFLSELSLSFWEQFTNILEPSVVVVSLESPVSNALMTNLLVLFDQFLVLNNDNLGGDDLSAALEATSASTFELFVEALGSAQPAYSKVEETKSQAFFNVISKAPLSVAIEDETIFNLFTFDDKSLQLLGLTLLKKAIAARQSDNSMSFALLKQPVSLQDEDAKQFLLPGALLSSISESVAGKEKTHLRQFLYSWIGIFSYFDTPVSSLRHFYLMQLKEGNYINTLLNLLASEIEGGLKKDTETHWKIDDLDPVVDLATSNDFERCVWNVFYQTLDHAGPLAKAWYLDLKNNKIRNDIENFTKAHISPLVINHKAETIRKVLDQGNELVDDSLDVQISKSGRVVTAYYFIDAQTMEVAFHYPETYPLKDIYLEGVQLVGVKEKQWRAWILASQSILKSTGGSLLDSLDLFKRNVTMHFDGVAACSICYSILHEDHTLPTKECGTCHNKFHTDCLYRWFKSGSTESCPLCRSDSFRIGH